MVGLAFALSTSRRHVRLRLVLWGVGAQWLLGVLLLRLPQGRDALAAASALATLSPESAVA